MFSIRDYVDLHSVVFKPDYPGYKPAVVEGDIGSLKLDVGKRYAHVALKHLNDARHKRLLLPHLARAHVLAVSAASAVGLPPPYWPRIEYSALRILEYPPSTLSHRHEDFDLFTLLLYRNQTEKFVAHDSTVSPQLALLQAVSPQAHVGQLGQAFGLGPATPHEVLPSATVQRSIVYFAIPDWDLVLPDGSMTVRDWLNARMAVSRTSFDPYK